MLGFIPMKMQILTSEQLRKRQETLAAMLRDMTNESQDSTTKLLRKRSDKIGEKENPPDVTNNKGSNNCR